MRANEIRNRFFEYFEKINHKIVPSAPIVNKDDPTLMFTNAGMNQFKDYFLGNQKPEHRRIADTQKCLRVSGKHNDLEQVGIDSYHHTMFEMLGNWSFGDYFKKEAIEWAWDLLTNVYKLPGDRLYVTVFGGDEEDDLKRDDEAADIWLSILPKDRILYFDRNDNFWEMGDSGPCGPCSEIHIDLRPEELRKKQDGRELVNKDHPLVIEIWNLVFIQFNRKADGTLEGLPEKHVDTGMGFERLCMAVQGKTSNYDTDLFTPIFDWLEKQTGQKYGGSYKLEAKKDIAFRVIADHSRAVSFTIADGQIPSNTGAGYVVRRILRRAVRYYFSFLGVKEPLIHRMVPVLGDSFAEVFPELKEQESFVSRIIHEEEKNFLRTLDAGLKKLEHVTIEDGILNGRDVFELYDTYGFPVDLTRLLAQEKGWVVDEQGFEKALEEQQTRSRADAKKEVGDWVELVDEASSEFVGYENHYVDDSHVVKYRMVKIKDKEVYQIVLDRTPFYAESGGQVGDTGTLVFQGGGKVKVYDTQKENDLIIHYVHNLPEQLDGPVEAYIDVQRRELIENNHSATHLLHAALRQVLGTHVQQRGSLVSDTHLRFDFSHFQKMTSREIQAVEDIVNDRIRENISRVEQRDVPLEEAKTRGAMMLFGEKYGETVRMITFNPQFSVELCGGCHVEASGEIGWFKIKSESAIAAGVRRIEALTAKAAESYIHSMINELNEVKAQFKNPTNPVRQVNDLINRNKELEKQLAQFRAQKAADLKHDLVGDFKQIGDVKFLAKNLGEMETNEAKSLAYDLGKSVEDSVILFATIKGKKVNLQLLIDRALANDELHAGKLIKEISRHIEGGGGGQAFYAASGGRKAEGVEAAIEELKEKLEKV